MFRADERVHRILPKDLRLNQGVIQSVL